MKLTVEKALEMLEESKGKTESDKWIYHSICVGNTASVIAKALNLDSEKAKVFGYIHDIGKSVGEFKDHALNGYNYLKELGYDEEYANICLTHPFLNNDYLCTPAGVPDDIPFVTNFIKNHKYSIYEKIINLCDLMCTNVVNTLDKRLISIIIKIGIFENTRYNIEEIYKLKEYFDKLLGYNIYDLFPEIKNNL